jgi:ubiquinone/menaquinone biosynthesis C-methylase UbiE
MPNVPADEASHLRTRAAPLLRLPTSHDRQPEMLPDGSGLRCPATGRVYPYRGGVLDLLEKQHALTVTQKSLDTPFTAWAYDRFRGALTRLLNMPDLPVEVAMIQEHLGAQAGDIVLDLACGPGNFTVEWAKRVGADGLVIGLDISAAMLVRAAYHVRRWGLDNILLVRGDAHRLPLAADCLQKVNCSGGFHQFPDLAQALGEIARVSAPGAVLTASTFAEGPTDQRAAIKRWLKRRFDLHFVPLAWLGEKLAEVGYREYRWSLPGDWFGYISARKTAESG